MRPSRAGSLPHRIYAAQKIPYGSEPARESFTANLDLGQTNRQNARHESHSRPPRLLHRARQPLAVADGVA
ncbi:hypothetical protein EMIT0P265_120022 [Pseudomonas zeae]